MSTLPPTPLSVYAQRRAALARSLKKAGGGVAVLPTAPEAPRNRDNEFAYRHDSYFYYLTGFTEPGAWLVVDATGHSTLLCRPKDATREIWDGLHLGPEAAPDALGVQAAFSADELDQRLPDLLANQPAVWFAWGNHADLPAQITRWLDVVRQRARQGVAGPSRQRDLAPLLDEMRLFKDRHEVAILRRAGQISAGAHVRAMQMSAAHLRRSPASDLREYHLEAELLHEFRRHGAQAPAYNSIVASGANACILHYRAADAPISAGQLCLIDAGCELDGYASDITRTFPANGRFSAAQRTLYDIVLAAQEAAIAATRPGQHFDDPHEAALRVLAQGMLDTRLLHPTRHGNVDDVLACGAYRQFYMHRTSHWMGMDVHDCGNYFEPGAAPSVSTPQGLRPPSRLLRPGMVLTVEPGLYVRPSKDVPKKFWDIGIRIEDDALVTTKGCELLTRDVPVRAQDIEALMRA